MAFGFYTGRSYIFIPALTFKANTIVIYSCCVCVFLCGVDLCLWFVTCFLYNRMFCARVSLFDHFHC